MHGSLSLTHSDLCVEPASLRSRSSIAPDFPGGRFELSKRVMAASGIAAMFVRYTVRFQEFKLFQACSQPEIKITKKRRR